MNIYNSDYFFIRESENEHFPFLVIDENTKNQSFNRHELSAEIAPFIFHNDWKEHDKRNGIKRKTPDVLFAGNDLVVRSSIREKLICINIPNLHIHPAVYIDSDENWHKDYWNLSFTERFDCWDRHESAYNKASPIRIGDEEHYEIYRFSLDKFVMNSTPLKERLLFKMGASVSAMITCHKSLISLFNVGDESGARFTNIIDY